jgi:hypothetical protein
MTLNTAPTRPLSTLVNLRLLVGWTIFCAAIAGYPSPTFGRVASSAPAREEASSLPDSRTDPIPPKLTVVDLQDIRFKRLPESASRGCRVIRHSAGDHGEQTKRDSSRIAAVPCGVRHTSGGHPATAYGSVALSFVIPSGRLAEASRERNDKACALCNIEG